MRVRTGGRECRLSPDCVGKHQGPKRKRLSGAPGAHKSAAGYTALAGPGAKGQSAAVNPAPSHPHSGCGSYMNINTHIASKSSSPLQRFSNRCRLLFPFRLPATEISNFTIFNFFFSTKSFAGVCLPSSHGPSLAPKINTESHSGASSFTSQGIAGFVP